MSGKINYYKDSMKHNDYGPSVINKSFNNDEYYIEDKKMKDVEFKNHKRTKLIDDMIDE